VSLGRELQLPGCKNVRDIGGLVRADDLSRLDHRGRDALAAYGVSLVVDLRSTYEIRPGTQELWKRPGYLHAPLIDDSSEAERDSTRGSTKMATYCLSIDRNARRIVSGLRAVANAAPGSVAIHCSYGRDRTGMAAALLLDLVGTPREEIASDYAASDPNSNVEAALEVASRGLDVNEAAALAEWQRCQPDTILGMLAYVDEVHGGSDRYVRQHGMNDEEIAAVQARLNPI
jgi:protein-tyrosine phosphatase